jgi:hypothetical protein
MRVWIGVLLEMLLSECKLTTLLSTNQIFQNYRYKKATFFLRMKFTLVLLDNIKFQ